MVALMTRLTVTLEHFLEQHCMLYLPGAWYHRRPRAAGPFVIIPLPRLPLCRRTYEVAVLFHLFAILRSERGKQ